LLRATIDPAHYHLGWAFERVEQNGSGVRVHFNGGRIEDADVLIGGDGIRSTVRGQVAPALQPSYAGYYIWRGAPNEIDLAPQTLKEIFGLPRVSLQPVAGAHGELTGILMVHKALAKSGNARKYILIPDSAHGTNPASAAFAGYEIKELKSNSRGMVDVDTLAAAVTDIMPDLLVTAVSIALEEQESMSSALSPRSVLIGLSCFVGVDTVGYLGALLLRGNSPWTLLLLLMPVGSILVAALAVSRFQLDKQRLAGLVQAATQALDWVDESQAEQALVDHTEQILRHSRVQLRGEPAGPGEISAELRVDGRPERHLVVQRTDADRFTDDDQRALDAITAVGAASLNRGRLSDETAYLARHDILTGLVNRSVFSDRLEHALTLRDAAGQVAVLYCDLDGFKSINDRLGHEAGDRLLVAVAQRLSSCLRSSDTASRIGGDEFAILVEALPDPRGPQLLAGRILEAFGPPLVVDGREVRMALSIGIAYAKGDGSGEDLLHQADTAMYRAKARGKGRAETFEPSMQSEILQRIELEEELRKAVLAHSIELVYQPVVTLATGRIEGFEALARWNHPTLGPVSPAVFIPMAEQMGLISSLGEQVLALGHAAAVAMRDCAGRPFTMGINVSPAQVQDPALLRQVSELIASAPDIQLVLELTESVLLADDEATSSALLALEEAGVAFAVDDFGVGYSSIGYLYRLPIKIVKLDRSLILALGEPRAHTLVQGVVAMAQAMGMTVLAEGIEDWATAITVRELGCPLGQGYVLAEPMPLDQALAASVAGFLHTSRLQAGIPGQDSSGLHDQATASPNLDR